MPSFYYIPKLNDLTLVTLTSKSNRGKRIFHAALPNGQTLNGRLRVLRMVMILANTANGGAKRYEEGKRN